MQWRSFFSRIDILLEKKIYTYLMDNPNSSTSEIRENFSKISATIYDSSLQQLIQEGLVYRTSEIDDTYSVAI